ncbi:hypothetical protein [Fibrella aquatilis]|uniref:Uncharacterized protein n=1 Tax=Fibrella aquatilis TaxID=2817059 RepID=A0A939K1S6_9BACT|nr:hypothetical protein [Fibrella aquatilis]MBO0933833.1 hypothetical protein [Fibrella aquatilis]
MQPNNTPEQTWLIDQYLAGNLTDDQQQRVDQRRQDDAEFNRQVLAHWLVQQYLEQAQDAATFNREMTELGTELAQQKQRYNTTKRPRFLIQVLVPSLAAAAVALVVWLSWPPTTKTGRLTLNDPEGYGIGKSPLWIAQTPYAPGLLGRLRTADQYRWPGDTLFVYGSTLGQLLTSSWQLDKLPERGLYRLRTDKRTYTVRRGQREQTPLLPDENETP